MKSATELLEAYLGNVRTPKISASQFAEDGVDPQGTGRVTKESWLKRMEER